MILVSTSVFRTENSGYSGMFVAGQTNLLNNNYYKALLKTNYVQV